VRSFRRRNDHDKDIADFLQILEKLLILGAVTVDVDLAASTANQEFPHGLGYSYTGAVIVGQSAAVVIFPGPPDTCSDSRKRFVLAQASATAQRARVLVF
jgi:hypothetical protein